MKDKRRILQDIFRKTDGYCHICQRKLVFKNYGIRDVKGAWQIEHSIPKAKGGTNHMNNLYAACVECNCDKGVISTRLARGRNGKTRAPMPKGKKEKIKDDNTIAGMFLGGLIGAPAGPVGIAIGATIGGMIGRASSPNR